ncbi:MAG: protein kinase [Actinomycetota bacterium]
MTRPPTLGGHELGEPLRDGSIGQRFRAVRRGRDVIVEATSIRGDDELFDRSIRRIELIGELDHVHLVPVLDVGLDHDHLFVVTPAPDEGPDPIRGTPCRSTRDALAVVAAAASGLAHLHAHGVLHRDVQPSHLRRYEGVVKLGDFGLCDRRADRTRNVGPIGAVGTMAPSIVRGHPATRGSDLYGLGASLHLLATGSAVHPLRAESLASRICRIGSTDPVVETTLEPFARELVVAALNVDGVDRDHVVNPVLDRFTAMSSPPTSPADSSAGPSAIPGPHTPIPPSQGAPS